jgi:hypothetical protein
MTWVVRDNPAVLPEEQTDMTRGFFLGKVSRSSAALPCELRERRR